MKEIILKLLFVWPVDLLGSVCFLNFIDRLEGLEVSIFFSFPSCFEGVACIPSACLPQPILFCVLLYI